MTWPRCFIDEETVIFNGWWALPKVHRAEGLLSRSPAQGLFSEHLGTPGIFWTFYSVAWFVSSLDQVAFFCLCLKAAAAGQQVPVIPGTNVFRPSASLHHLFVWCVCLFVWGCCWAASSSTCSSTHWDRCLAIICISAWVSLTAQSPESEQDLLWFSLK